MRIKKVCLQVTCVCSAYKFPHRIGGGKCSGIDWVESYMEISGNCCEFCNSYQGINKCDVADGREAFSECDGYQQELHNAQLVNLPISLEDFFESILLSR